MKETITIVLFIIGLLICLAFNLPIVYALFFGYIIFFIYGLSKSFNFKELIRMSIDGVKKIKNMLIMFVMIGMISAIWRESGTIPFIIYHSLNLVFPKFFVLITFLLCCIVSILLGTAFGSAATIGVICMTISNMLGINKAYTGGAILSGIFFGDRSSPMSTSAILVSEMTNTNLFKNIRNMIKTSIVPFIMTCIFYTVLGLTTKPVMLNIDLKSIFTNNFNLSAITIVPAILILLMSILKIDVKLTMFVNIIVSSIISISIQKTSVSTLINIFIFGYYNSNQELNSILSGGGILSMINTALIIGISSAFANMFEYTGLLDNIKVKVHKLSNRFSNFTTMTIASLFVSIVSCNQILTLIITHQLCKDLIDDNYETAIYLENGPAMIPPLIPWSIAAAVPFTTISAPNTSIFFAFYLYSLIVYNLYKNKRQNN